MDKYLGQMEEDSVFSDLKQVRAIGHAIKGSARNLSMDVLGMAAEELEYAGRDEKADEAASAFQKVKAAYEDVKENLAPYLAQ